MEDLENLSDEDIQQLMQLGIIPDQLNDLQGQIDTAEKLRHSKAPQGYDTGRVYVAANPLEHLARALEGIKAGRDIEKMRAQQQALLQQQVSGRKTFLDSLREIQPVEISQHRVGPPPGGY